MFDVSKETAGPAGGFLVGGKNEDVVLVSINRENAKQDGTGNVCTALHFESATGGSTRMILWDPNEQRTKENAVQYPELHKFDNKKEGWLANTPIMPEHKWKIALGQYNKTIYDIMACYLSPEELETARLTGKNVDELIVNLNKIIAGRNKGEKVRVKLVYNKDNYLQLPKGHFIEKMSVKDTLKINDWEKVVKDTDEDPEHPADVLDAISASMNGKLPF